MEPTDAATELAGILRPFRFAARQDFKNLSVLKDLESSTRRALQDLPPPLKDLDVVQQIHRQIDGLDALPESQRRLRVESILAAVDGGPPPMASEARPRGRQPKRHQPSASPALSKPRKTKGRIDPDQARPETPLASVVGVGPKTAERLAAKGLVSVEDLFFFVPKAYEDRSRFVPIRELKPGVRASVQGTVRSASVRMAGRGKRILELAVKDDSGTLSCRFFRFHQSSMESRYARGTEVVVSGQVTSWGAMKQMVHPEIELSDAAVAPAGIIPVYREIDGVPAKKLRQLVPRLVESAVSHLFDPLPEDIRGRCGLADLQGAVRSAHLPTSSGSAAEAMTRRLVFDELFYLQLALARVRTDRRSEPGVAHACPVPWSDLAAKILPFSLTGAQARAVEEIVADLASERPMHRLLQGDVGSGKTAVAFLAAAWVYHAQRQAVLMAPTEILAEQHFGKAEALLQPHGIRVALLTGSTPAKARSALFRALGRGDVHLLVGTHAVLEPTVAFQDLGLAIVDEQHRFGVAQRARLQQKRTDGHPDILVMTATPIPRTLALTAYGDLHVTLIDELPPGRTPTETRVYSTERREEALDRLQVELQAGRQAYVVYPLIDASEKLQIKAATEEVQGLQKRFGETQVALLHGRMTSDEKAEIMKRFVRKELSMLVSTTVIEVGVDVPNATVMIVENAERFGLSQLHQLRGRVGRGGHQGHCLLIAGSDGEETMRRLGVMEETSDGFVVAERDLALRGPGEILGTRQSGLPDLVAADLARDARVVMESRVEVERLLAEDPQLEQYPDLAQALERRMGTKMDWSQVG